MSKILAIDYGEKRLGIALSDETKTIAIPKPYINADEKEELLTLIEKNNIEVILLGLPLNLQGQDSIMTGKVRDFAEWLKQKVNLPIHLIDERFSSQEIARTTKDREAIDSLVAQKMLERHLEKIRSKKN